jgi:hypothetical protein
MIHDSASDPASDTSESGRPALGFAAIPIFAVDKFGRRRAVPGRFLKVQFCSFAPPNSASKIREHRTGAAPNSVTALPEAQTQQPIC